MDFLSGNSSSNTVFENHSKSLILLLFDLFIICLNIYAKITIHFSGIIEMRLFKWFYTPVTSSSFEVLIHFRPPLLYCGNFISKHELPQGQRKKSCIVIRHPAAWPRAVFDLWGCSIYANELLSSQEQFPEKEGQRFFIMSLGLHHSVWKSLLKVSFYNVTSEASYVTF